MSQKRVYEVEAKPVAEVYDLRLNHKWTKNDIIEKLVLEVYDFMQLRVCNNFTVFVLQNVIDGYNGAVMAYGQIGTGKNYTLGKLRDEDTLACGIMVQASHLGC